jgi:hypothetical protein
LALVPELTSQFQREFKIYKPETNFKCETREKEGTAKRFHFFHLAATHTTATARVYGLKDESRVNLAHTITTRE